MKYLEIPKNSGYYDYTWRNNQKSDNFGNFRQLPAPLPYLNSGHDEKLVDEYLSHFLSTRDNFKPFEKFIRYVHKSRKLSSHNPLTFITATTT